jgi:hypothetical protein
LPAELTAEVLGETLHELIEGLLAIEDAAAPRRAIIPPPSWLNPLKE